MKCTKKLFMLLALVIAMSVVFTGCNSSKTTSSTEQTDASRDTGKKTTATTKAEETQKPELPDTVRWFNASYAILTELNGWDYNIFGGLEPTAKNQEREKQLLDEWWGVTDRATADETLEWILTEGHRFGFIDNMSFLKELGLSEVAEADRVNFILENFDVDENEAKFWVYYYSMYENYGDTAIDGWDYCRALNLLSYYYIAGYYTQEEALDKSLEIAKSFQSEFTSWDELIDSYLRGYEYWSDESSDERRKTYEEIKKRNDNPYAVDYNITLEKSW